MIFLIKIYSIICKISQPLSKGNYACTMSHTWRRGIKGGGCKRAITVEGRMPRIHIRDTTFDRGFFGI